MFRVFVVSRAVSEWYDYVLAHLSRLRDNNVSGWKMLDVSFLSASHLPDTQPQDGPVVWCEHSIASVLAVTEIVSGILAKCTSSHVQWYIWQVGQPPECIVYRHTTTSSQSSTHTSTTSSIIQLRHHHHHQAKHITYQHEPLSFSTSSSGHRIVATGSTTNSSICSYRHTLKQPSSNATCILDCFPRRGFWCSIFGTSNSPPLFGRAF